MLISIQQCQDCILDVRLLTGNLERRKSLNLHWVKVCSLGTCFPGEMMGPDWRPATLKGALWYLKDGVMTVRRCLCIKRKQSETALNMSALLLVTSERNVCWPGTTTSLVTPKTTLLYCAKICVCTGGLLCSHQSRVCLLKCISPLHSWIYCSYSSN